MNSILITCKDKQKREQHALTLCSKINIDPLDITVLNKDTVGNKDKKKPVLSIGIDDIKVLQNTIHLKPIKSQKKACIIQDAQLLTVEAQNAMLKILEEPPANTLIILTADSKETLLPTILSRCKLIEIQSDNIPSSTDKEKLVEQIDSLRSLSVTERLVLAETLAKNKDETIIWLEKMILVTRDKLLEAVEEGNQVNKTFLSFSLKQFQKTYQSVQTTNINLRLTLENLFLSILTNRF